MNYPLDLSFKLLALANQISVIEAQGNLIFYLKQKMFKLKEAVTVFADKEQLRPLYKINADRMIDFRALPHHRREWRSARLGKAAGNEISLEGSSRYFRRRRYVRPRYQ